MGICKLLNSGGNISVPEGVYETEVDKIKLKAGTNLNLNGVTIKALPTADSSYGVISIDADNVTIRGGHIIGERDKHLGTPAKADQWGHCLKIKGGKNIRIQGLKCSKAFGDGICISGGENIEIVNCEAFENRRQGISVTEGKNILILDSIFRDTGGHAPQAGIDVEPDHAPGVDGCFIRNCQVLRNKGYGITLFARNGPVKNTKVEGCIYKGNVMGTLRLVSILSGFQDILYDLGLYKPTSITVK